MSNRYQGPEDNSVAELEIGIFKSGRRAYGFDDIAIVPSRRTRDPEDVDISWQIDAYQFELPLMASAMDGVVSPSTAIEIGRLGGLGVLNLEGLWTRYEDPSTLFDEIRELPTEKATARMQQMYAEPVQLDLVTQRIKEMKAAGITTAASVTPQKTESFAPALLAAELDILVIQGTVVSAEHVSKTVEPLNLKRFIREFEVPVIVGGCASYQAGLHLMRTGAVGVLVGVGPGNACTTRGVLGHRRAPGDGHRRRGRRPHAPPRRDGRLLPRHRRRRHVQGRRRRQGRRLRRRRRRCWARPSPPPSRPRPAASTGAWPPSTRHCPVAPGCKTTTRGTLQEILLGPAHENDGRMNLFGALRTAMATCGYQTVKEFQKAEVMVAPALQTEGKDLQRSQGVGMGH